MGLSKGTEVGCGNCLGFVIRTKLILGIGLIRLLVVDVVITLGGLIAEVIALGMSVQYIL